jgi:hypothetical protein
VDQPVSGAGRALPSFRARQPSASPGARRASAAAPSEGGSPQAPPPPPASLSSAFSMLFAPPSAHTAWHGWAHFLQAHAYLFFLRGGLCSVLANVFHALAVVLLLFTSAGFWATLSYTPFMAFPGIASLLCLLAMLLLSFGPLLASALFGVHGCQVGRCYRAGMLSFVGVLSTAAVGVFASFEQRRYLVVTSPPTLIVAVCVSMVTGFVCLWVTALLNLFTVCAERGWCCQPPYNPALQKEEEQAWAGHQEEGAGEQVEIEVSLR